MNKQFSGTVKKVKGMWKEDRQKKIFTIYMKNLNVDIENI